VNLQAGTRAQNYSMGFTEPYLFDRAITGGVTIFKRRMDYINQFTESSAGGTVTFGFPVRRFTRFFVNYSYEHTTVSNINEAYTDPLAIAANPYLADVLLISMGGGRTISKIVPSLVYNTVDNPIFPNAGQRYTATVELAGVGGDTNFYKPSIEGAWYIPQSKRTTFGFRVQAQYLAPFSGDYSTLPMIERLYLGGEYSVRGFDIRTIGPKAPPALEPPNYNGAYFLPAFVPVEMSLAPQLVSTGLVIGGNKLVLFNGEYLISIAGPVRLVLFYDAGEVQDSGQKLSIQDFKTSTGLEVRFFMPVLNVPFRLIFAYNPQRAGILDSSLNPQSGFAFKFAIGSTF
jgi:outer membrane protein insertion porin family